MVGISLRKYPGFQQKLWADLAKPVGAGLSLTVVRGSWRATLPKAAVEAIATHIAMVRQDDLAAVVTTVMGKVAKTAERKSSDPDIAFEQFIEGGRSTLAKSVIGPLLDRMEGFFERTEHKPIESLRELEDQLSARLINGIESSSGAAFSRLLVEHDAGPLETVLHDQLNEAVVRGELEAFFASFSASDLYVELSDLVRSSRLIDNVDFYLHIGEVKHSGHVFPIFYIPFTANGTEQGFNIRAEPRLYVNKRAMDYVAQSHRMPGRRELDCRGRHHNVDFRALAATHSGTAPLRRVGARGAPGTQLHRRSWSISGHSTSAGVRVPDCNAAAGAGNGHE